MNGTSDRPDSNVSGASIVGKRIARYEILCRIASGGAASVYVGRTQGIAGFERLVAIKVLHPNLAHDHDFVAMFLDEARLAARVRHPNVVATIDIGDSGGDGYFMVMEYVEGTSLNRLLAQARRDEKPLDASVSVRIAVDMLNGLSAAHDLVDERGRSLNLVHRDISPHNLLVGVDGISRITDFGVAKAESRIAVTREGMIKGKLNYMAPELFSLGLVDQRTDLWAAAVVLWELLTGRRLFRGDSNAAIMSSILSDRIPAPSSINPNLARFDKLLARALAHDPAIRFQTASEFCDALEETSPGLGIAAPRMVGETVRTVAAKDLAAQAEAIRTQADLFDRGLVSTRNSYEPPISASVTGITRSTLPRTTPPKKTQTLARILIAVGVATLVGAVAVVSVRFGERASSRVVSPTISHLENHLTASPVVEATQLLGERDHPPVLLDGEPPVTPDPSMALTPTVVCRLHLDTTGHVIESSIYRSRPDLSAFEPAALAAVRNYHFSPARQEGRAVEAWINLPVRFQRAGATQVIRIKGSDTIGSALGPALAHRFHELNPNVSVQIEALGSSTAFVGLFDGSADIGASSRPVNHDELTQAQRLGTTLQEFVIGYDGVAIIVHHNNPIQTISIEALALLFSGVSNNWSALGGPGSPVHLYGRPSYSGTHAFILDRVVRRGDSHRTEAFAPTFVALERNEDIVRSVALDPNAIGYVPLGLVTRDVHVVSISTGTNPSVTPTRATIQDGSYPIDRQLLMYTRGRPAGSIAEFLRFVLSDPGHTIVTDNGFVPSDLSGEDLLAQGSPTEPSRANIVPIRVLFDERSRSLNHQARDALDRIAAQIQQHHYQAYLEGNSDSAGSEHENARLAVERARAVARYLLDIGVPATSVHVESASSDRPLATNGTADGRSLNRRVDVFVGPN